jgi:osmotically-inducible protein OsmY
VPPEYLVQHIQDALATDPRALELGVDARVTGTLVVLTGTVATPDQRDAIGRVAGEVVGREAAGHEVVNELAVASRDDGGSVEELG